jgi:hypothetical protein
MKREEGKKSFVLVLALALVLVSAFTRLLVQVQV